MRIQSGVPKSMLGKATFPPRSWVPVLDEPSGVTLMSHYYCCIESISKLPVPLLHSKAISVFIASGFIDCVSCGLACASRTCRTSNRSA